MLLLLLVASDGPSRLTKARTEAGYRNVKQGLGGKQFLGEEGQKECEEV